MACLAQCLGPERMRKLIRCAEAIERVQDQPGLVAAVKVGYTQLNLCDTVSIILSQTYDTQRMVLSKKFESFTIFWWAHYQAQIRQAA